MSQPMRLSKPHQAEMIRAREQFFDRGERLGGADDELPGQVARSWQRCRDRGLDHLDVGRGEPEGRSKLGEARDRSDRLLANASGIMEHLHEQIRASGSMVILADDQGMILHSLGDPEFFTRAQRVALQPGATWSETMRGTNAIGTTLVEGAPVEVVGAEHYLDRNGILTCSAAPLRAPDGRILGVLDISADYRNNKLYAHTRGLARLSAQMLEKRLFETELEHDLLIAFHPRAEYLGGLQEGMLALSADGRVSGANEAAMQLLQAEHRDVIGAEIGSLFKMSFSAFMDRCSRGTSSLQMLEARCGEQVAVRLRSARTASAAVIPARRAVKQAGTAKPICKLSQDKVTLTCLATGDPRLQQALDRAARVTGKDIPLLIQGESGVGKELFARAFHHSGPRRDGPFVALNCAAIPESLIESELFGYVGGAFTGARREGSIGKIQQAHGGTLFLDEIGDMPLSMQARLLRVLQERCVSPIGGQEQVPVDISLVCATHRVLRDAIRAGAFREDLYYRVNGLAVTIPPLRERGDIRTIVQKLLELEAADRPDIRISDDVMALFERYAWPGNVRQLQSVVRVAVALLDGHERDIERHHLNEELFCEDALEPIPAAGATATVPDEAATRSFVVAKGRNMDEIQREAIAAAMQQCGGNVSAAARHLGISRNTLYRRMGRLS